MKNLRDIRFVRSSDLEFHEAVKICFILQLNTARKSQTPLTNNFTCKRFDLETYTYLCDKRKINHCPHPDFFRQNIVNYRTAMKEDSRRSKKHSVFKHKDTGFQYLSKVQLRR